MNLVHYLGLLHRAEEELARGLREVGDRHADEADVLHLGRTLAAQCEAHAEALAPVVARYGEDHAAGAEPERLHSELFRGARDGPLGLLRDLQDLYLMVSECDIAWTLIGQAAQGLRDDELFAIVQDCERETAIQQRWLQTRLKQAAPQALVVART